MADIDSVLKKVADIYYRKCCWDDAEPCDYCQDFDAIRAQHKKPKVKKKIKKVVAKPTQGTWRSHGPVCICDECM